MKNKTGWRYAILLVGLFLTAILGASISMSKSEADCIASEGQTVVRWKDMYWYPCKYTWNGTCLWPIRRKHITYKVIITEGIPARDSEGKLIPIASGKIRDWKTYDSAGWNAIENIPVQKNRYPDYEPIAENEVIVLVETRYRLFHNVEANLRICTEVR
jgi:hypothetical protein